MGSGPASSWGPEGRGCGYCVVFFPSSAPWRAYACSRPLLTWEPLARTLTHTQAHSQHTCPLLVRELTCTRALCLSGKLNHSGRCLYPQLFTWHFLHPPLLRPLTHIILWFKCTLILL